MADENSLHRSSNKMDPCLQSAYQTNVQIIKMSTPEIYSFNNPLINLRFDSSLWQPIMQSYVLLL